MARHCVQIDRTLAMTMIALVLARAFPLALALALAVRAVGAQLAADALPDCKERAARGECRKDRTFMLTNCLLSCFHEDRPPREPETRTAVDLDGFYAPTATTANGKELRMERFDVYDTVVYTAARMCDGSTEAFYANLEKTHALEPYALEILVFPYEHPDGDFPKCHQTNAAIEKAADQQFKIHVMEPIKINGPDAHPVVKYLKEQFDIEEMDLGFSHNFKINPNENSIEMTELPNFYALMAYLSPEKEEL